MNKKTCLTSKSTKGQRKNPKGYKRVTGRSCLKNLFIRYLVIKKQFVLQKETYDLNRLD